MIKSTKIAICFHLGYIHRFNSMTPYIDNIIQLCPKTDIYITYREDKDPTVTCLEKYPRAVIFKAVKGCDVGAFMLQIKYILKTKKKYDLIFKIHTKSNNKIFQKWDHELLDPTAGSTTVVSQIINIFHHSPKIGMIGGKSWVLKKDIDCQIFNEICKRNKISKSGNFIGGTIFWVRFPIIKSFFDRIDVDYEYSLCETGKPNEPSYTHSWERVYGLMVNTCNYEIYGN